MKGYVKMRWIVVATWLWWVAIVTPASLAQLSAGGYEGTNTYSTVKFTTSGATKESYLQFVNALRSELKSRDEKYGIAVLPCPSTVPDAQPFRLVELTSSTGVSVTLAVDVTTANVVAFQTKKQSYFFLSSPNIAICELFVDTQRITLSFGGSYVELEKIAGKKRDRIELGILPLDKAISLIYNTSSIQQNTLAHSLIVVIQMVSDAARFRYFEQRVLSSITNAGYKTFYPNDGKLSLVSNWITISSAVTGSNQGVFACPIQLQGPNKDTFYVYSVTSYLVSNVALLQGRCGILKSPFSPLIRSVVGENDDFGCLKPEPTVRLIGRNGLCADVTNGSWDDGTPIELWLCKPLFYGNQLWTLKSDGTFQANGKCLTAKGTIPGSLTVIFNCTTAAHKQTRWELSHNGSMINKYSGLALTANGGDRGTELTLETNVNASSQSWLASNNTEPFETLIVGFSGFCVQDNKENLVLTKCDKMEQIWALFGDGSIRPVMGRNRCVTIYSIKQGNGVNIFEDGCNGSSNQRWIFKNDGTILSAYNGFALDVSGSQVIARRPNGSPTQQWFLVPAF